MLLAMFSSPACCGVPRNALWYTSKYIFRPTYSCTSERVVSAIVMHFFATVVCFFLLRWLLYAANVLTTAHCSSSSSTPFCYYSYDRQQQPGAPFELGGWSRRAVCTGGGGGCGVLLMMFSSSCCCVSPMLCGVFVWPACCTRPLCDLLLAKFHVFFATLFVFWLLL